MRRAGEGILRNERLSRVVAVLGVVVLAMTACNGGEEPEEQPPPRFGTGDGELLVLAESDAPRDMTLRAEISGPQSLRQFTGDPERAKTLSDYGSEGGYLQQFSVDTSTLGESPPSRPLNATTLYSEVLIFEADQGAMDALSYLHDNPNPTLEDVEYEDAPGFGDGAYLQISTSGDFGNAGYYWRADNALVSVVAQRQGGKPNEDEVLKVARDVAEIVASADASGEDLELPPAAEPGAVIFEDDFEQERDWALVTERDPPDSRLTRYVDGTLRIGIDGPGGRWHDTTGLENGELDHIGDSVVEADVEHEEGDTARWGLMCNVEKDAGFYLFVIGADGFAGIFSATSPNQPLDPLAVVTEHEPLEEVIAEGRHRIRADCAGDPIARLALYVNDEFLLDAYDDDPLPDGAAGMWIESQESPASARFDEFVVAGVRSD